ncbi:agamous-like MADS-box protein AGL9 homolog [Phalaenopsis equestris]|uniref:agamous-like MADS-box protein AGL9 homolog n=1 Tax=Phalaenopsis equestris TaxID=78828 RepID=UPI0009E22C3A|nr:agamous-like MADS-box protein AGL9 homolog [Phalaenopsis equestris]
MGRGKVQLKRIENKINRQVTFAKRRNGLLKKARELSILCDVEVALIIYSNHGKLSEFCSNSSMLQTLERYEKHNNNAPELSTTSRETQIQGSQMEYITLKSHVEALQRSQRNLMGEDLGLLGRNDLDQLERQLNASLAQIRFTKTQYMHDQLCDLQQKEISLLQENESLRRTMEDTSQLNGQQQAWDPNLSQQLAHDGQRDQLQGDGFYYSMEYEPNLQMGFP